MERGSVEERRVGKVSGGDGLVIGESQGRRRLSQGLICRDARESVRLASAPAYLLSTSGEMHGTGKWRWSAKLAVSEVDRGWVRCV